MTNRCAMFSQYFKDLDKLSWREINNSYNGSKAYDKAVNMWKVPLQKKAEKRLRKSMNPPHYVPDEASGEGMIHVHNAD